MFDYKFFYLIVLITNTLLVFNIKNISKKIIILDIPDKSRKIHKNPTPLFGGLLIYFNILIFLIYFFIFDSSVIFKSFYFTEIKPLIYFIAILSFIFLIGIYDDKYSLSPLLRLFLISILIIFYLISDNTAQLNILKFSVTDIDIRFGMGSIMFSYLCLIILLISCNMFDGINLQSFLFYFFNFIFLFFLQENIFILLIALSLIFFGLVNYNGKLFMGDSGVYLISFLLGIFYIKYYNFNIANLNSDTIFSILFFPVLDASRCIFFRIIYGKNPFQGDNNHFHHLLIKKYSFLKSLIILSLIILIPFFMYYSDLNIFYSIITTLIIYFFFYFKLSR